jgi:uncharacterized protein with HEPN domain
MTRDEMLYLRHILDAMDTVEEYLHGVDESKFKDTRLIQDGVIRQIEIIGEAVRHVSKDLRKTYPEIPWQDIAGMRDKLIHVGLTQNHLSLRHLTADGRPRSVVGGQISGVLRKS